MHHCIFLTFYRLINPDLSLDPEHNELIQKEIISQVE